MEIVARTGAGPVEGRDKDGVLLFAGIPYAAPPTGERRFAPPQPHPGWTHTRSAKRFGPAAPQRGGGTGPLAQALAWDEDCLTVNVQTPAVDGGQRPVLVWIHGGAFRTGKGGIPWYNGRSFAQRGDIVVVTINYRLGALGFAHLADLPDADGSAADGLGLLDQIAALEWVRDNIASFGGDPQRVTIAGESAGGMSVGSLLGSPLARGLFRGAIAQSGAAQHTIGERDAAAVGRALVARLGVHDLEGLRALPVDALLDAQVEVEELSIRGEIPGLEDDRRGLAGMVFRPVVGGHSLPSPPLDAIRAGLSQDVSVLVGTNLHETTLFHPGPTDDDKLRRLTGHHLGKERVDETLATYRAEHPDASPHDLLVALTTDWAFRIPAVRLAEAQHAAGGRAWQYLFTWESRGFGGHLRSTHALEIPFAWNTLDAPGVGAFLGEGVQPQGLAEAMHRSWIEFVHEGAVGWPAFDPERRPVMEFGDEVGLRHDPYGATRRLFDGVR